MRFKCTVAYKGTFHEGWQSQPSGNTIQDILEAKLAEIFKTKITIHGSGRTDSGVHAKGQVFHFDANWKDTTEALCRALNSQLPPSIRILTVEVASEDFHARFSAKGKTYTYWLTQGHADPFEYETHWSIPASLNLEELVAASKILVGKHNFSAYSALRGDGKEVDPFKEIYRIDISSTENKIKLQFEGSGFLYKMVRSLVGALVEVGLGRATKADLLTALETGTRTKAIVTAPPQGLFLEKVYYD